MSRQGLLLLLALLFFASSAVRLGGAEKEEALKVEISVVPNVGSVQRSGEVPVVISITNPSGQAIRLTGVSLFHPEFKFVKPVSLPPFLPPHGEVTTQAQIKALGNAAFGDQQLVARIQFEGSDGKANFVSGTTATFEVDVRRPWSDEASGLPGGNPALFFLLLPILPAFVAFQVADRLRHGEGWTMPKFDGETIVSASLLGLLANSFLVAVRLAMNKASFAASLSLDPTNPIGLLSVLMISALVGVAWPLIRWLLERKEWHKWAFREEDTAAEYLEKALLGPLAHSSFTRVIGTANREKWEGVLHMQPNGIGVLGSTLQVTSVAKLDSRRAEEIRILVDEISRGSLEGNRQEARQMLIKNVQSGELRLEQLDPVLRSGKALQNVVAVQQVDGLAILKQQQATLLCYVQ